MTANQFNKALKTLGFVNPEFTLSMGQSEFARAIGVSDRNVRRWAAGQWPVPVVVSLLLKTMLKHNLTSKDLPA